jgi:hypothetical protein
LPCRETLCFGQMHYYDKASFVPWEKPFAN